MWQRSLTDIGAVADAIDRAREAKLQRGKEWREKARQKRRGTSMVTGAGVDEVMCDLEEYNREHGTHLSYGQYVHRMRMGML